MKAYSKNSVLTWLVVILILANITVIVLFLQGQHNRPDRDILSPAEFLVKQLSLNAKQQDQLHQLATEHHKQSEIIKANIKEARNHFFDLLKQSNISDSAKNVAAANVAANLKELELLTFNHFQQVRMICDTLQQKKFDQIINHVVQMLGAPPAGPPPNGSHPSGRPPKDPLSTEVPGNGPPGEPPTPGN